MNFDVGEWVWLDGAIVQIDARWEALGGTEYRVRDEMGNNPKRVFEDEGRITGVCQACLMPYCECGE